MGRFLSEKRRSPIYYEPRPVLSVRPIAAAREVRNLGLECESGRSFLFIVCVVNTWEGELPPAADFTFQSTTLPESLSQGVSLLCKRHPKES